MYFMMTSVFNLWFRGLILMKYSLVHICNELMYNIGSVINLTLPRDE